MESLGHAGHPILLRLSLDIPEEKRGIATPSYSGVKVGRGETLYLAIYSENEIYGHAISLVKIKPYYSKGLAVRLYVIVRIQD